ncbi:non-ribosomal peptide synthase/polyketide synthase, partial [Nocardia sp. NPDC005978]|uniref:non-ribosomal peptide synthetase n=1 Tax=Nocardia sp. NPDC005978 TaxID=3156725 RepID=UPI0033A37CD4
RVGADDDFFALGGHSISATRVAGRLAEVTGRAVGVRDIFDAPTVAGVARVLAAREIGPRRKHPALVAGPRPARIPLSFAQLRMWFGNRFEPEAPTYNIPLVFRLAGVLDIGTLAAALNTLIDRHEALRTRYPEADGVPYQDVVPGPDAAALLEVVDVGPGELSDAVAQRVRRGFDLRTDLPLRATILRSGRLEHVLVLVVHHIAADGLSMAPLLRDLSAAFGAHSTGREPGWSPLPVQYPDYALWQRDLLGTEADDDSALLAQCRYWERELAGAPQPIALPADRQRPPVLSNRGGVVEFTVDAPLREELYRLAREHRVSASMVLQAALVVLLSRLGAGPDVSIGGPVGGRTDEALRDVVGFFVNTWVLRVDLSGDPRFDQVLDQVRGKALTAYENQDAPFERLVERINPIRSTAHAPLFQVSLELQSGGLPALVLPDLVAEFVPVSTASAKHDLHVDLIETLATAETPATLLGRIEYATDLFDHDTVTGIADRFLRVLTAVSADPAQLVADIALLDDAERDELVTGWNADAALAEPESTVTQAFRVRVEAAPSAVAVACGEVELTYADTDERVAALARELVHRGVGRGSVVAVALPRSADLVIALLAVVTAGGAYLPIDPEYPSSRIEFILGDADPSLVLTTSATAAGLPLGERPVLCLDTEALDGAPDGIELPELSPADAAYVIYTSGSTGRPKGVVLEHRGVVNMAAHGWPGGPGERVLLHSSMAFDASAYELWPTLLGGSTLVVAPPGRADLAELGRTIARHGVTALYVTTPLFEVLAGAGPELRLDTVQRVVTAGDALRPVAVTRFRDRWPGIGVVNAYGPTENTVCVTAFEIPGAMDGMYRGSVPIGAAIGNMRVFVLDSRLRPVPVGVAGELYVAGTQLARGYRNRPGLTAERFPACPFGAGTRMYRTGDVVRWTREGILEFVTRADEQVKVRGYRIEPGEVETALTAHPLVAQAVVIAREIGSAATDSTAVADKRLVGYVVLDHSDTDTGADVAARAAELRRFVADRLPEYMVPAAVVVLDALPLTPNGKVDRRALPAPSIAVTASRADLTPAETIVVTVFAEVLGLDVVGVDDDFFALGGHSLSAMRVASRLTALLGSEVGVREVFEAPTSARLAAALTDRDAAAQPARAALTVRERPERTPLSFAQSRLWFINRFEPDSPAYNIPMVLRLRGPLDQRALADALGDVVARHESLRTVFPHEDGVPFQRILPAEAAVPEIETGTADPAGLDRTIITLVRRGFDVSTSTPLRVTVLGNGSDDHIVVLVLHHIAADGWSIAPFVRDLTAAYTARRQDSAPAWTPLPVQYADFALWQRETLGLESDPDSVLSTQFRYWETELADAPQPITLPVDRPRPAVASNRGDVIEFAFEPALSARLYELAHERQVTVSMLLQSALAVLLSQLGAGDDVCIGGPVAGRTQEATHDLIGFFVNTWVLRVDLSGDPRFEQVLEQVRRKALTAYENQDAPFERLVELLQPTRSPAYHSLFQVSFALQNNLLPDLRLPELDAEIVPALTGTAKFDLHVDVVERMDPADSTAAPVLSGRIEYATDLFDRGTVLDLADRYLRLLATVTADPAVSIDRMELLAPQEHDRLLRVWNDTSAALPQAPSLDRLFAERVAQAPDAIAVAHADGELTYRELATRVDVLARVLMSRGVVRGSVVAVAMPRSADLVTALLAVVAAGAAYLPIDTEYPSSRIKFILNDADPVLVVTTAAAAAELPLGDRVPLCLDETALDGDVAGGELPGLSPSDAAYVIYTSGSTGRPKGVVVQHHGVINMAVHGWPGGPGERVLLHSSMAFDASAYELWPAVLAGSTLVVAPPDRLDLTVLMRTVARHRVTTLFVATALFELLATAGPELAAESVRQVVTGGDALSSAAVTRFRDRWPGIDIANAYGPTENTVCVTTHRILAAQPWAPGARVPIGAPVPNVRVFILDARLRPVPTGVAGELYVAGAQLARGYSGRLALTAQRFVACPFGTAERMYRTGDVVRWTRDGVLEFAGRADDQVKVRGYRIEPGEVEAALVAHPAISRAVVVARTLGSGDESAVLDKQLVAYIVRDRAASVGDDDDRAADLVDHWRQVYDNLYGGKESYLGNGREFAEPLALDADFGGWNSSYTGEPIPVPQMREWRDAVVDRVLELRPEHVLEIGVGSGLLMSRLAERCAEYWCTDFSAATIANLRSRLHESAVDWAERVLLRVQAADDTTDLPAGRFDVVVINSVAQYFPNAAYLIDVIAKVMGLLAPGGALFLGDIRNLSLLREFATGTQLAGSGDEDTAAAVRERARRTLLAEQELLVAPEFFLALREQIAEIAAVDIELKYAPVDNELTRYRYDIVLRKTPARVRSLAGLPQRAWTDFGDLSGLRERLAADDPGALRVTGIPQTGTMSDVTATRTVDAADEHTPVAELDLTHTTTSVLPHEIREVGTASGYTVAVTWSPVPGLMDALLVREADDAAVFDDLYLAAGPLDVPSAYANDPGIGDLVAEVREFATHRLPEFMIPGAIVILDELPLLPSGKVDRRALPEPQLLASVYRAPATPMEEVVVSVFAEILGIARVGADDDFFALGGHSLSATRVASRVATATGVTVEVRDVFDAPTPTRLAAVLAARSAEQPGIPLTPQPRPDRIPLSFAQSRMWFINRFEPDSAAYNIAMVLRLRGELDAAAMSAAIADLAARHESLRTVFPDEHGVPCQRVLAARDVTDISAVAVETVDPAEITGRVTAIVRQGFDVAVLPPWRTTLLRTASDDHLLVTVLHHIVADGWSIAPLVRDLSHAYTARRAGRAPEWTPLPVQYADYTLWQRELLGAESDPDSAAARQLDYWTGHLAGLPDHLELPADRPRPAVASQRGGTHTFVLDAETVAGLNTVARTRRVTAFMVVHAALATVLSRLSGSADIAVGTPIAGRGAAALDGLVGMFVNTLVLRTRVEGSGSFADLLDRCRATDLAAFAHADIPFERVVEALDPPRSQAHHPLFQVLLAFQNLDLDPTLAVLPGLEVEPLRSLDIGVERFDLTITVADINGAHAGGDVPVTIGFAADLFDEQTIAAFADRLVCTLRAAVADPAIRLRDLNLLAGDERESLRRWNDGGPGPEPRTLAEILEHAAREFADRPALTFGDRTRTYRELDDWSNRCARALIAHGAGPETAVAIAIARSADWVRAVWAVAKTGAAFVSLDPAQPRERNLGILADCAATIVLTADTAAAWDTPGTAVLDLAEFDPAARDSAPLTDADRLGPVRADTTAYIVYTSGSTGIPKGVTVTHAGLTAITTAQRHELATTADARVLTVAARTFDAAIFELLLAVPVGATLVVAPAEIFAGAPLTELMRTERVTHACLTPAVGATLDPDRLDELRVLVLAGEACPPDLVRKWSGSDAAGLRAVHNLYGPSEATIWVTGTESVAGEPVSIGTPIPGIRSSVRDAWLTEVPPGVVGELYVSGPGVARGYLNRAGVTAAAFVADPSGPAGSRMYRTGDLVRWQPADDGGGALVVVGRADTQIKIRGQRLELGEIAAVLTELGDVQRAVVTQVTQGDAVRLAAYLTAAPGREPDPAAIRHAAARRLPSYMVPDTVTVLDELPLTATGKVDLRALPEPEWTTTAYRAPAGPAEETVAAAFAQVLGLDRVGADDDFFALGGDSIVSIQLVARAKERGVMFTPRQVFEARTVAALASVAESVEPATILTELPGGGVGEMPLTPIVRWMVDQGGFGRLNQTLVLTAPADMDRTGLTAIVRALLDRHDMLRSRLWHDGRDWRLEARPSEAIEADALVHAIPLSPDLDATERERLVAAEVDAALNRLDPAEGAVLQVLWFSPADTGRGGQLVVVAHHLVVDGVSWRILLPDLAAAWQRYRADGAVALPPVGTSMRRWAHGLAEAALAPHRTAELPLWQRITDGPDSALGSRAADPARDGASTIRVRRVRVSPETTEALLTRVPAAFHGEVQDALVAALAVAVLRWRADRGVHESSTLLRLEGHGREEQAVPGADLTATAGWFTTMYPVRIPLAGIDLDDAYAGGPAIDAVVKSTKEHLRSIPDHGIGYGLLRYLNPETAPTLPAAPPAQVAFNYLGQLSPRGTSGGTGASDFGVTDELGAPIADHDLHVLATAVVDVTAAVTDGSLSATFGYLSGLLDEAEVDELAGLWVGALDAVVARLRNPHAGGHTPSDFPLVRATQADITAWEARYPALAEVWPLSPLQSGLLFHARLAAATVDVYAVQLAIGLSGRVDAARLRRAADGLLERYSNLRVAFNATEAGEGVQIVADEVTAPWREIDLRAESESSLSDVMERDRAEPFDTETAPLMRYTLVTVAPNRYTLLLSYHHVLFDGWSMPTLLRTLLAGYAEPDGSGGGESAGSYRSYLDWLARQNQANSVRVWRETLEGADATLLAPHTDAPAQSERMGSVTVDLDHELSDRVIAAAVSAGVTVNTLFQVAWAIVVGYLAGRDDVVFGATVSGRPAELPGIEAAVGLFINTIPVRIRPRTGEPVAALLNRVQAEQSALLDHHHIGLSDIHAALDVSVLFDTVLVFESYPVDEAALAAQAAAIDDMRVEELRSNDAAHYPLALVVIKGQPFRALLQYRPDTFEPEWVRTVADRLVRALTALTADVPGTAESIDLLSPAERDRLAPVRGLPAQRARTLAELLAAGAAIDPAAPAIVAGTGTMSFGELDARSNRLARLLIDRGAGPGTAVALALPRSTEFLVGLWAVTKTGAAFVPIDPRHPLERVVGMIADSDVRLVLSVNETVATVPDTIDRVMLDDPELPARLAEFAADPVDDTVRTRPLRTANIAYVVYTSGSTGTPKGVVVSHDGLANFAAEQRERYALDPDARVLAVSATGFDAVMMELLMAHPHGATLVVSPQDVFGGPGLTDLIRRQRVTHAFVTTSVLSTMSPAGLDTLRVLVTGGERVPAELVAAWAPNRNLYIAYGPTETVIVTLLSEPMAPDAPVTLGGPIRGIEAVVLDALLRPVPVGVRGELYLGGIQQARGYSNRPGQTAAAFVADPFGRDGSRLYRTGDLAYWNTSGTLEFAGRNDFQVKVRGQRVELGEIEAVLGEQPGVQSVIVVQHARSGRLIAYLVGDDLEPEGVLAGARHRLPAHMVPDMCTVLPEFPLTVSGKVDRAALPEPEQSGRAYREPSTPAERTVAEAFAEVLGLDRVGVDDDFFALGGHSLSAMRVTARLAVTSGARIGVRDVFESPTPVLLARVLDATPDAAAGPELIAGERPDRVPLSFAQLRMWFINRFQGAAGAYTIPLVLRLTGDLDTEALIAALADVVGRHESLRTMFPDADGTPYQRVLPAEQAVLPVIEQTVTPDGLEAAVAVAIRYGFDLSAELPIRVTLLDSDSGDHVLALVIHHIAADGWSIAPLARDLSTAYAARRSGRSPRWVPLPVQYADYTLWQRATLGAQDDPQSRAAAQLAYWTAHLAGLPDRLELPADRPRPMVPSHAGHSHAFALDAGLFARLGTMAEANGVTVFMVVHAAVALLLSRLSGASDIAIGTPIAGRGAAALDDLVGMFVNTLVLRTRVDEAGSFADLLGQVRRVDLDAFAHADIPFEQVVEAIDLPRTQAHHPLFQVMLAFQNLDLDPAAAQLPGLRVAPMSLGVTVERFDLSITVADIPDARGDIPVTIGYATDLFDRATVAALARRFERILIAAAGDPATALHELDPLDAAERKSVRQWGDAGSAPDPITLNEMLARAAARFPEHLAVADAGHRLTYGELDRWSNRCARLLIERGAGPERVVAIALPRSAAWVRAVWAVAKTGAAFVSIDPAQLHERNRFVLTDVDAAVVLAHTGTPTGAQKSGPAEWHDDGIGFIDPDLVDLLEFSDVPVTDADRSASVRPGNTAYLVYTSGTTGTPKGVAVTNAGLAAVTTEQRRRFELGVDARVLAVAARTFDAAVFEMLSVVTAGSALIVAPGETFAGPDLTELIEAEGVTHACLTPAVAATLDARRLDTLRVLMVAGEACPQTLVRQWSRSDSAGVRRLFNLYGPSETTIWAAVAELLAGEQVSLGGPIPGLRLTVLDAWLRPVPLGVVGELYIAGPGVARGYLGQAGLTAGSFVADPDGTDGARMYRTGDLVRWVPSGDTHALMFAGRADRQIKIRAQRLELGEIETALARLAEVGAAVVVPHTAGEDPGGAVRLAAYVTPAPGQFPDPDAVRQEVAQRLPSFMVPGIVIVLDALPLTSSGKVDRRALPAPEWVTVTYRAPATPFEDIVVAAFTEILEVDRVGADDDFFDLGGHSLSATRVAARVAAAAGVEVSVRDVFDAPTAARLGSLLADRSTGVAPGRSALVVRERPEYPPLSFAQWRMWFINRLEPDSPAYNIPLVLRLTGELDVAAMTAAIGDVVARHETLRTVFPDRDGNPYQRIIPAAESVTIIEQRRVEPGDLDRELVPLVRRGFELTTAPPLRVTLLDSGSGEHVLVLVMHHIAADGWSLAPLAQDLALAYDARRAGRAPEWAAPLPVQYADYTLWQREVLGSESDRASVSARQVAYWTEQLAGLPDRIELPADRTRPAVATHRGDTYSFAVDATTAASLHEIARAHRATVFMVMHAALAIVLARVSGGGDIAVGTPVAGRGDAALDGLIGMFVNTLVLRTRIDEAGSFGDLLDECRRVDLAAFAHADIPFERVVEAVDPPRTQAHHPLFQVMLAFQNLDLDPADDLLPGIRCTPIDLGSGVERFDLTVTVSDDPGNDGGLLVGVSYALDLFDRPTILALTRRLHDVIAAVAADPEVGLRDIEVLDPAERELLSRWGGGPRGPERSTLAEILDRAAVEHPDRIALADAGGEWTYRELDRWSNQCARMLIEAGVGPESIVAVAIPRSAEWVRAVWAVARTGAAFVSMDPAHPAERNRFILADCTATVMLTSTEIRSRAGGAAGTNPADWVGEDVRVIDLDALDLSGYGDVAVSDADRGGAVRPDNTAYVIYTSGSTGKPKGVAVTHTGLAAVMAIQLERYEPDADSRVLAGTARTFDAAIIELLVAIPVGAVLVVAPDDVFAAEPLAELLRAERITHAFLSPAVAMSVDPTGLDDFRELLCGGEACPPELVRRWSGTDAAGIRRVHNVFGPSECSMWIAGLPLRTGVPVSLGGPIPDARLTVLDSALRPVPPGAVGELYVAGPSLARGYIDRAGRTSTSFVADPFGPAGSRMYRTGDLVRWACDADGDAVLMFAGRADFQVKIRGQRLELGEIETALADLDAVRQSVVTVHTPGGSETGGVRLAAYVTAAPGRTAEPAAIRQAVAHRLPSFMVPDTVTVLDTLPLTVNGKVDRRALPAPEWVVTPYRAPSTPLEQIVVEVFSEILEVERVGVDDDFFTLGGTSVVAMRLTSQLRARTGTAVPYRLLFADSTPASLARYLAAPQSEMGISLGVLSPLRSGGHKTPLFCVHPGGGLSWVYGALAGHLDPDRPIYALQDPYIVENGPRLESVDAYAERYVEEILRAFPDTTYHLLGWSLGGKIAHAMAARLQESGHSVGLLALVDAGVAENLPEPPVPDSERDQVELAEFLRGWREFLALPDDQQIDDPHEVLPLIAERLSSEGILTAQQVERVTECFTTPVPHTPPHYDGDAVLFVATRESYRDQIADTWDGHISGTIHEIPIDEWHTGMMNPRGAKEIGAIMNTLLRDSDTRR